MANIEDIKKKALEAGFSFVSEIDCDKINLMPEVRAMCATNSCGKYDKNWACPPGCGELLECAERVHSYKKGIVVQTVGDIEDSFDFESMMEIEAKHKENFTAFAEVLREELPELLPLGAGTCTKCKQCTYPDAPCRFPGKSFSSMEAYGMLVSDVCTLAGMKYNHGQGKMAYTSCYLLEK